LGFSLTEMLIATGIMAIGLVMVATIFPVGVKLTSLTTERTIGAVVADEAFAKIQLYGLRVFVNWPSAELAGDNSNATYSTCNDFMYTLNSYSASGGDGIKDTWDDSYFIIQQDWDDFLYPSTALPPGQERNYHWSALCRRVGLKDVQITVFVTRKIAVASKYRSWDYVSGTGYSTNSASVWPNPVPVNVTFDNTDPLYSKELKIVDGPDVLTVADTGYFFDDGYTIVDDYSGQIYRVLEVKDVDADGLPDTLVLQQDWVADPLKPVGLQPVSVCGGVSESASV
jgi:hypothetical protein